jgi:hypothetical protein
MNERIQLLAEQAGYLPDMFGIGHWDMPECKKFAELIVQECIQAIQNEGQTYEHLDAGEFQANNFSQAVKQHFGVEE